MHGELAQGLHLGRVADVGLLPGQFHALPLEALGQGREALAVHVAQHQAQAARAGFFRQAAAYAAGRPGDHRHLAGFDFHG
ncbi:hypothetical protein FQZ97_773960 [compost metagenome]